MEHKEMTKQNQNPENFEIELSFDDFMSLLETPNEIKKN